MIELLVAVLVIGCIYWIAAQLLPHPIPVVLALVLLLIFVLIPLLEGARV